MANFWQSAQHVQGFQEKKLVCLALRVSLETLKSLSEEKRLRFFMKKIEIGHKKAWLSLTKKKLCQAQSQTPQSLQAQAQAACTSLLIVLGYFINFETL